MSHMNKKMNELRELQNQLQNKKLPAADRFKARNLMHVKMGEISGLMSAERSRLRKAFACAAVTYPEQG